MSKAIQEAVACIRVKKDVSPAIGMVTGSGWDLTDILEIIGEIPYCDIPGFSRSTVEGHKGRVLLGSYKGKEVLYLQGRVHYYEGYTLEEVSFPIEVLSGLGVKNIIITNAAGGIRSYLKPGDFMVITDHINLMGINPLRGLTRREGCTKFVDMSEAYDKGLVSKVLELGTNMGIAIHCGVLAATSGPSYETPAEIQMLRIMGADAVCMSTVPEVITSRYLGMRVLGLSMITNCAAGFTPSPMRHPDVVKAVELRRKDACRLVSAVIENMM